MDGKTDRRVIKTKERLYQVLIQLLAQKPIKDITVKELSEQADINRATFYLHYTDVFDLLEQVELDVVHKFEIICKDFTANFTDEQFLSAFSHLLTLIRENREFCTALFSNNSDKRFFEMLVKVVIEKCFRPEYYSDYGFAFALAGCVGIIMRWMRADMQDPIDSVSATALKMINRVKG